MVPVFRSFDFLSLFCWFQKSWSNSSVVTNRVVFGEIVRQFFLSFLPEYVKMIFCIMLRTQYNLMSVALVLFSFAVPFTVLFSTVFSVYVGVGGCGWTISARAVRVDVLFWKFSKNTPNSASVVDAMKFLIIIYSTCAGPFSGGIAVIGVLLLYFGTRVKYPPTLLHASSYEI